MTKTRYTAGFRTRPAAPRAAGLRDASGTSTASSQAAVATVLPESHFDVVIENDKAMLKLKARYAGLYTTGFLSARGKDDSAGTGGGSSLQEVWNSLKTNTDSYKDTIINVGHIPTLTVSKITGLQGLLDAKADLASTLAGYGITDAYTSDEVDILLSAKADVNHEHSAADITSGTLSIDRIPTIPYSKTSGVQAVLVSGTSIKTINGVSVLGSGNIVTPDTTYSSMAATSGGTDLSLVTTGEKYTWNAKQAAISDLSTIRSNAANGATAYGWGDHSKAGYLKSIANLVINGTVYDGTSAVAITTPTYTLASFGITASATELNYTKGVTSAIQTQLDAKADASALASYLPLSGGTMSNTNVVTNLNADLLDGTQLKDILYTSLNSSVAITSTYSLNDAVNSGINFTSWAYANSSYVNNQPAGDGVSSAGSTISFGTAYPFQLYTSYNGDSLYCRTLYTSKGWSTWKRLAFSDSNVASASKLLTSRKLWGKSFDGTADVSGDIVLGTAGAGVFGVSELAGAIIHWSGSRTIIGSLGSSTKEAPLIRSITGHIICGNASKQFTMLDSGNYNTYSPSLTGTGASGTWNINVSGTAKALKLNNHTYTECPTIGDLKTSLITNMATGGDINYPVQSYNFQGSNVLSLKNNWATDSYTIADGSRTSFLRLDRYVSDKYGAFLMSGMSIDNSAGLSRLLLYNSKWYGPYMLLDETNYSSYALPLTGGTLTGNLAVNGNSLFVGNSSEGNIFLNRPSYNYIWAANSGGMISIGTKDAGITAPSIAAINIKGRNVQIGGEYHSNVAGVLHINGNASIFGSNNPLIEFLSSTKTHIGYVQAMDAGWMGIGPGGGKGLFIGSDGALTINATPPTTPTGNSIDAPKAIHSTTGVYSEGYVSARGVDSSSDGRLKTDIRPLTNALDYILNTRYHSFKWKSDGKQCMGVIAQEELGREHGYLVEKHNDSYSYNYAATTALLGAALQEEDDKVEKLKARIAALEAELERHKYNS